MRTSFTENFTYGFGCFFDVSNYSTLAISTTVIAFPFTLYKIAEDGTVTAVSASSGKNYMNNNDISDAKYIMFTLVTSSAAGITVNMNFS